MSEVPSLSLRPTVNPEFVGHAQLSAAEKWLLSRVDGLTTVGELVVISGPPREAALEVVTRLCSLGAILFPASEEPRTRPLASARAGFLVMKKIEP